tara:strand:+ start:263 stop:1579 length:1317 start_codon:yes stop_codon:yes gene_type:complete
MGWLRKTVKKIGKGIKKAFMKFGKFMGKIGIVGQIAMMFILPGIGAALFKGVTGAFGAIVGTTGAQAATAASAAVTAGTATAAQTALAGTVAAGSAVGATAAQVAAGTAAQTAAATGMLGSASAVVRGAGTVLQYAGKAASMPGKVFKSVTNAVTNTIGEFSKTALNKIPGVKNMNFVKNLDASDHFFSSGIKGTAGETSAFGRVGQAIKAPFSETARASITARQDMFKNQQKTLLDAVGKVDVADATKINVPEVESLTTAENTRLSEIMETPLTETQTSRLDVIKQEAADSLLVPKPTAASVNTTVPTEQYAALGDVGNQFVEDIAGIGVKAKDTVTGKLSNLANPAQVVPALAKTAIGSYEDAQYAESANRREPEVIDLGISEDPRQFLSQDQSFFQNSAIGPYQVQNANTYTPQSSWAQQQMLMLQQQQQQGVYA